MRWNLYELQLMTIDLVQVRGMMAPPLELPAAVAAVCRAVTGGTLSTCDKCTLHHGCHHKRYTTATTIIRAISTATFHVKQGY